MDFILVPKITLKSFFSKMSDEKNDQVSITVKSAVRMN